MRRSLFIPAAALLAWGCSDSTGSSRAAQVAIAPGAISLDAIGATRVVHASVRNASGKVIRGAKVTWATSSDAVTVAAAGGDSAVVTSAATGSATVTAQAGEAKGTVLVEVAQLPAQLVKVGGDGQFGAVGAALPEPLRVVVRDRLGAPVPQHTVTFAPTGEAGIVAQASVVTAADGTASTLWTLSTSTSVAQRVAVSVAGGAAVLFNATARPGPPSRAVAEAGSETGIPGTRVATAPRVRVTDGFGNPVGGLAVNFAATAGGGSVTGAAQTTSAEGRATVGSWTLGTSGTNTLTATFPGTAVPAVPFNATARGFGTITIVAGANQMAMAGTAVPTPLSALVRDSLGAPVAGVPVTFAVAGGFGTISTGPGPPGIPAPVITDARGVATIVSWTLGARATLNTVAVYTAGYRARSTEVHAAACSGGGGTGYAVTVCYASRVEETHRAVFEASAARWSSVIRGDLPDMDVEIPAGLCTETQPNVKTRLDDLIIVASFEEIDGRGGVLGQAGPCVLRASGLLPILGIMEFDVADVAAMQASGQFGSVILHEMGHVLGIGTLWEDFGLLMNPSTTGGTLDTYYRGAGGRLGFDANGGAGYTGGQKVPVENSGGAGTMNAHWRESVLANELMTGYLGAGSNPLSALTVNSLVDIGYTVDPASADNFSVGLSLRAPGSDTRLKLHDDVLRTPRYTLNARKRLTRLR